MTASRSARARVRAEITGEIISAAREELALAGPVALSLRAVARRLDMVPSALYRYFPSRDALLTALIIEAYRSIGAVARSAASSPPPPPASGSGPATASPPGTAAPPATTVASPSLPAAGSSSLPAAGSPSLPAGSPSRTATDTRPAADAVPADPMGRWLATAVAVREWAHEHPHEWALVYGSPVPGYRAPEETIEAAMEITRVLAEIVRSAAPTAPVLPLAAPPGMAAIVEPAASLLLPDYPPELVVAALMAWTQLIGTVSLELFGHFVGATTDFDAVFRYAMQLAALAAGIPATPPNSA